MTIQLACFASISCMPAAAALGLGRWAVELATIAEYSGLDNAMQHLATFKLAQLVSDAL